MKQMLYSLSSKFADERRDLVAKVKIQTAWCIEIAEHILAHGGVPADVEDPMPYKFPEHIAHNGWCALVAINQQTTPVVGPAFRGEVGP